MRKKILVHVVTIVFIFIFILSVLPTTAFAAVTPVEGISVDGSGASLSGTSVSGSQSGLRNATGSMTVTYTGTEEATVTYSYSVTTSGRGGTVTLNGGSITGSGTVSEIMKQNDVITYTLTSAKLGGVTLTLSNFVVTVNKAGAKATVTYDSTKGSVSLGGSAVSSGGSATATGGTLAAVATPASGCSFVGWVNADTNELLNTAASATLNVPQDMNIRAVFVNSTSDTAWFMVDNMYLTDDLNYASATLGTNIVLMNSGTLKAGTYTIQSGDKLLIPHSASDTGAFTGEPSIQITGTITAYPAKAFRTLTVPSGTTITCNGEINVNGHRSANGQPFNGHVIGDYGKMILGSESTTFSDPEETDLSAQLIIGSGGKLYCYGYITGSGMVNVQNGGTVHELLQLADWPGGTNGIQWKGDSYNNLFLATQYYVQNIEAPLKLDYGATEYVEAVITITLVGEIKFSAQFISSSGGMFIMADNGYILRIYDQAQDRMNYHFKDGSCTIGTLSMKTGIYSITTENSILALTNNLSVYIEDGATLNINKPVALLPGSELIIETDGTVNIASSALYIFDVNDWCGIKDSAMSMYFNRIQQAINEGWAPTDVNTSPQTNPLPHVATLNSISPRATGYYYLSSNKSQNQTNPKPITDSGKLEVNGTLNINSGGYVYASSGETSSDDKVITGTGTIVHNGSLATAAKSITVGTSDYAATVSFDNALGNLAGVGEMQPFTNGGAIYYGLGDYWYQWKITTEDDSLVKVTSGNGTADSTISNGIVGYVANSISENGIITFTADGYDVYLNSVADENKLTPTDGTYTLTGVTANTTLVLVKQSTSEVISVTITWEKTELVYTKGQWDPETHTYEVGKIATTTITIINKEDTNVDLIATLTYEKADGYTGAVTGELSATSVSLLANATERTHIITLTLNPNGEHPESGVVVGKVTVTISKPS